MSVVDAFVDTSAFRANIEITLKNDLSVDRPHARNRGRALVSVLSVRGTGHPGPIEVDKNRTG